MVDVAQDPGGHDAIHSFKRFATETREKKCFFFNQRNKLSRVSALLPFLLIVILQIHLCLMSSLLGVYRFDK